MTTKDPQSMKNDCGKYDSYSDGGLPNGPYQEPVKGGVQAVREFPPSILALLKHVADRSPPVFEDERGEPMQDAADAALAWIADRAARRSTEGWVSVPRKPTKEMLMAGLDAKAFGREDIWSWDDPQAVYLAMLAAAPTGAAEEKGQES